MECALHRRCHNPALEVWVHLQGRPTALCLDCQEDAAKRVREVETHWEAPIDGPCPELRPATDEAAREAALVADRATTMAAQKLGPMATRAQVEAAAPTFRAAATAELARDIEIPSRVHPKRTTARREQGERAAATPRCSSPAVRSPATRAQSSTGDAAQAATGGVVPLSSAPSLVDAPGASVADGTTGAGAAALVVGPVTRDASAPEVEAVVVAEASGVPSSLLADPSPIVGEGEVPPVEPTLTPTPEPTMRPPPKLRPNADSLPTLCRVDTCEKPPICRGLCNAHCQAARKGGWLDLVGLPPQVETLRRGKGRTSTSTAIVEQAPTTAEVIAGERKAPQSGYALLRELRGLVEVEPGASDAAVVEAVKRLVADTLTDAAKVRGEIDEMWAFHSSVVDALGDTLTNRGVAATIRELRQQAQDLSHQCWSAETQLNDALPGVVCSSLSDLAQVAAERLKTAAAAPPQMALDVTGLERAARFRRAVVVALGIEDEATPTDEDLITSTVRMRQNLDLTARNHRELAEMYANVRIILAGADDTINYVGTDHLAQQIADRYRALRAAAEAAGAPVGPTQAPSPSSSPRAVELAAQLGTLRIGLQSALGVDSIEDKDLVGAVRDAPKLRVSAASWGGGTIQVVLHGEGPAALPIGGHVRLVAVVPS